ncbi:MAG: COX15/CtaA family protein [Aquiluna sp.]|nr:COX15/CtaA family protein [Aquiluna sp.]
MKQVWFGALVAPARLRLFVWLSLATQILIVVTGGLVRLTGSGLGCPTWPKCTDDSLVSTQEMGIHGIIEFGNRLLTFVLLIVALLTFIVVVRRAELAGQLTAPTLAFFGGVALFIVGLVVHNFLGLGPEAIATFTASLAVMLAFGGIVVRRAKRLEPTGLVWPAFLLGAGIILQAVVGGITVLTGLNSWIVGLHFVISMFLIALAALLVWRALPKPSGVIAPLNARLAPLTVVVGLITTLVGVVVTGAGPHAGDAATPRNGLDLEIWQHYHSYPGYLLLALIALQLGSQYLATRSLWQDLGTRILTILMVVTITQAAIGIIQSRLGVPEFLVAAHMLGAAVLAGLISFQFLSARRISR